MSGRKGGTTGGINSALSAWAGFTAGIIGVLTYIARREKRAEAELAAAFEEAQAELDEMDDYADVDRHFTQQYNVGDPVKTVPYEDLSTGVEHEAIPDATITHAQFDAGLGEWLYGIDQSDGLFVGGVLEYDAERAEVIMREQEAQLQAEIDELLAELSDVLRLIEAFGDDEYIERSGKIRIELTGKATALEQARAAQREAEET
ncbi:hypothetical protein D7Z54_33810 [Salibacterium salarium]|uniref:Uncharacterized protein n=1 Tax=Salibacterium salarium TaxID=284579 RepID=A0A3R9NYL5_9BACI|nr:hypothetical protein [Salibacterium salarium]RSL28955.1 hypothetical protein D7Z54_33810 [Salibacterium salarium]